ncbi:hypothetical protein SAMN04488073_3475 [Marinobacter gudaonensis]|uniref:Uncharacterized protein n=1 Tax=Marinobacter gudaonensis TaxID=375760 RepID=A0A1I6I4T5_9GAMM|nr:hypothetical protein [Marinobacter gudaonensis]SFR61756.1 hypothetical protein SAMN04488073_3475 [Marinobacter gudaonensis]
MPARGPEEAISFSKGENYCSWNFAGQRVLKEFSFPIGGVELKEGDGVAVVPNSGMHTQGYIFNLDGSVRHEFMPPDEFPNTGFYAIRYDGGEALKVIVGVERHGCYVDLACVLNPVTGKYEDFFEIR